MFAPSVNRSILKPTYYVALFIPGKQGIGIIRPVSLNLPLGGWKYTSYWSECQDPGYWCFLQNYRYKKCLPILALDWLFWRAPARAPLLLPKRNLLKVFGSEKGSLSSNRDSKVPVIIHYIQAMMSCWWDLTNVLLSEYMAFQNNPSAYPPTLACLLKSYSPSIRTWCGYY